MWPSALFPTPGRPGAIRVLRGFHPCQPKPPTLLVRNWGILYRKLKIPKESLPDVAIWEFSNTGTDLILLYFADTMFFRNWRCVTTLHCQMTGSKLLIPGIRRSPGEGNRNPLQFSCLGNHMNRGAWQGYSLWGSQRVRHDLATKYECVCSVAFLESPGL